MLRFVVDEDLPRSTVETLRNAGYQAEAVRDIGLRGRSDEEVFEHARRIGASLVTADLGFANVLQFPPGSHQGIVVVRVPDTLSNAILNRELVRALEQIHDDDLIGALVIVEVGRVRIRRAATPPTG